MTKHIKIFWYKDEWWMGVFCGEEKEMALPLDNDLASREKLLETFLSEIEAE